MAVSSSLEIALENLVYTATDPWERVAWSRRIGEALVEIVDERSRQEAIGVAKRAEGIEWRSCADPAMDGGDFARATVLGEEYGEVCRASLELRYGAGSPSVASAWEANLRKELVETAAVSLAWIEAIDRRAG